jgi:hypothetical protein
MAFKALLIILVIAILMDDSSSIRKTEEERKEEEEVAKAVNKTLVEEKRKEDEEKKQKDKKKKKNQARTERNEKDKKKEDVDVKGKDQDEACPPLNSTCPTEYPCPEVPECPPCKECGSCPPVECGPCPTVRPCKPCPPADCQPCSPRLNRTETSPTSCPEGSGMSPAMAMAIGAIASLLITGVAIAIGLLLRYTSPIFSGLLFIFIVVLTWYLSSHYPETARELGGRVVATLREATIALGHRVMEAIRHHNNQVSFPVNS